MDRRQALKRIPFLSSPFFLSWLSERDGDTLTEFHEQEAGFRDGDPLNAEIMNRRIREIIQAELRAK